MTRSLCSSCQYSLLHCNYETFSPAYRLFGALKSMDHGYGITKVDQPTDGFGLFAYFYVRSC